ncbi:receptor-type adenylate cyclase [Trypanosoma theileri]|uniref:adenylate cyclase n=1 Tax=Trypanosoma theileri TaxID=67003 RepID=A0A1X0P171_9TRYP|nr:receptor-type adenylate cyclase [Trypanosoma theileri]ORC90662.1 receptor-type adenylate cyclase [Trypanosoma theileri]
MHELTCQDTIASSWAFSLPCTFWKRGTVWGVRRTVPFRDALLTLLLLVSFMQVTITAAQKINVTVLEVLNTENPRYTETVKAYRHGFLASLWHRNHTGRTADVNVVHKVVTEGNIAATIEDVLNQHNDLLTMVGPVSSPLLLAARETLQKHNIVAFAPLIDDLSVRFWDKHFYFLMGDMNVAVYTLMRYAMAYLRVLRVGFMYMTGVVYGEHEYKLAEKLMADTGRSIGGVFCLDGLRGFTSSDAEFQEEWEKFVETRPQAVLVMGTATETTKSFIRMLFTDNRTSEIYVMAPARLQELLLSVWRDVEATGTPVQPGRVFTTGSNPLASDTSYKCIKRFQEVMGLYLKNSGQSEYQDDLQHLHDVTSGEMMVAGWMAGEVFMQTLDSYDSSRDRDWYVTSLFAQRRYLVDDFVIGDFGDTIDPVAAAQGAMSECNQGGNLIYLKEFENSSLAKTLPEGQYTSKLTDCYPSYVMHDPALAVTFLLTDFDNSGLYVAEQILAGLEGAIDPNANHLYNLKILPALIAETGNRLELEQQTSPTDIVVGLVTDEMLSAPEVVFIDPIFFNSRLNSFIRNVILLGPTTEQQVYVLAQYLASTSDPSGNAVVRGSMAEATLDVVRRSFVTFGVSLRSGATLGADESLEGKLSASGLTLAIEILEQDIEVMARHLEKNKDARLAVLFSPFAVFYPQFLRFFSGKEIAERMLITTSLPHWADPKASIMVSRYHEVFKDSAQWSPLSLSTFVSTSTTQSIAQGLDIVDSTTIANYFYSRVMVTVDDMMYGPYTDGNSTTCTGSEATGSGCGRNYGATSISVWPLTRAFDSSVPPLMEGITPSMIYREPEIKGLTKRQIIGIAVGAVFVFLLIPALLMFVFCRLRNSRDNENAPKEPTDPVTLVFTDIESSTALWAACPEIMPDAVATHHRLIRALIAKYRCYEVKTIGDSFMIACRSVFAAVQLARELQQSFLQYDWGTSAIEAAYHVFEEGKAEEDDEYVPPTARLDAAVYGQYWNGLRVRVGMHTGLADIQHDEVTKGYDYYGSTSNMAARTESVANGGQVLLTRATYMALSTAEREQLDVTALGPVALRGVPKPVEMYQLDAVPGRTFAALRLDNVNEELLGDTSTSDGCSSEPLKGEVPNPAIEALTNLLTIIFSPFPLNQRAKAMQPLLQRWNVNIASKPASMSHEDYCRDLTDKLGLKLCRVIDRRAQVLTESSHGAGGTSEAGRGSLSHSLVDRLLGRNSIVSFSEARRSLAVLYAPVEVTDMSGSDSNVTIEVRKSLPTSRVGM